jgi:uncharacterized membrane protein
LLYEFKEFSKISSHSYPRMRYIVAARHRMPAFGERVMTYADHRNTEPGHTPVIKPVAIPHIRRVGLDRPWAWLAAGWNDFSQAPVVSLSYGLALVAVSYMLVLGLSSIGLFYLVLPMVAGFMLVGPIVAVGLYEVSRLHNLGREAGLGDAFRAYGRNGGQISAIGLALMLMLLFWVRIALLIFALFFSYQPPTLEGFVSTVFFTEQGLIFLVVGSAVGGIIACAVFAISALSIPMLLDRDTDLFTAIFTSVQGVMINWKTMVGWAGLIVLFTAAGLATAFIGLALALPLIGYASWHAYKEIVDND